MKKPVIHQNILKIQINKALRAAIDHNPYSEEASIQELELDAAWEEGFEYAAKIIMKELEKINE